MQCTAPSQPADWPPEDEISCNLCLAGGDRMQFDRLRRREFITLVGGAAVAWPIAARAQQRGVPVIGFLGSQPASVFAPRIEALRKGLHELGYVEGKNLLIDFE
jgi:hypothetical protein